MTAIRIPQAVALDTAILAAWARGWARGDPRAQGVLEALVRSNARLLITLHHAVELLGHASDDVVASRARFVRALGQVFWVRSRDGGGVGTVLDVQASEIRARLVDGAASYQQILSRARPDVLAFGDAKNVADLLEEAELIAHARERIQRRRIVASIARTQVSEPDVTQRRVAVERYRAPLTTILSNFEREERHLTSQLTAVGDRRLVEQDKIAKRFFDELRVDVKAAAVGGNVTLTDALRRIGIEDVDLARLTSADQIADKYIWKRQSRILARIAGVSVNAVEALRRSEIPSLHLCEHISASRSGSHRAEGGDVDDASLACLSLYASLTSVDKRTAEYIRQIRRRSPELDHVMGGVVRLTTLEALETSMPLWHR
jgi:hypothetical protein